MMQSAGAPATSSDTFVIPILYTTDMNVTQMMIDQKSPVSLSPTAHAVNTLLKRFHEVNAKQTECSIYPAVRELLTNLVV
jgi:mediator of RNA polymerase II transcription subunit 14